MICILSPTQQMADQFARSHFLARKEYFWANSIDHIKGRIAFHVLIVGFFENQKYFESLLAYAQHNGARGR